MQTQQRTKIELGGLEQLDLSDVYVLQRVDALCALLDLSTDDLGDELAGQLGQSAGRGLALDDLGHLLSDGSDLGRGGIGGLLDLVWSTLGEGDGEQAEEVVICCLDGDVRFDEGLPLSDQGAELV